MTLKITCKVCGERVVRAGEWYVHDETPPIEYPSHQAQAIAEQVNDAAAARSKRIRERGMIKK